MKTRILTGFVIGILLITMCWFSGTIAFPIVTSILSLIGIGEMLKCLGVLNKPLITVGAFAYSLVCGGMYFITSEIESFALCYFLISAGFVLYLFVISTFSKGKISVDEVFSVFATSFYIVAAFSSLWLLRSRVGGQYLVTMTIWLPLISDIFAYFTGYFLGRHKLIPDVSPKKTVEGSIGGMTASGIAAIVFALVIAKMNGGELGILLFVRMFAVGAIASLISQAGDLIMSVIKRRYGIKDYGKLFPGHGGVLDRFDSVMAVAPIVLMLTFFPAFVSFAA